MSLSAPSTARAPETPRAILTLFAVVALVLAAGMTAYYVAGLHGSLPFPQDQVGYVLGRDFINTWFYGKAAFLPDPGRWYDHDLYLRWIAQVVPHDPFNHLWSYPPIFLLMAAPFGLLGYPAAFAAWTLAGLLALYAVVRGAMLRTCAILLSPAALFCLIGGQISLFMAAIAIAALRLLDRRPVLAGLLIALCAIKPQTGLLFPVLLIAARRWRVLAAATIGVAALAALTVAVWGMGVWRDYWQLGLAAQLADTRATYGVLTPFSPTVTTAAIMLGLTPAAATCVQAGFTLLAAGIVAAACRGPMDARRQTLFLACSVLAAPYLLSHDLVAVTAAAVAFAATPTDRLGGLALKGLYLLPMLQFALGAAGIPGAALVPLLFALRFLREDITPARRAPGSAPPAKG